MVEFLARFISKSRVELISLETLNLTRSIQLWSALGELRRWVNLYRGVCFIGVKFHVVKYAKLFKMNFARIKVARNVYVGSFPRGI